jgi:peptide/nickel transport system substrate-binding protein
MFKTSWIKKSWLLLALPLLAITVVVVCLSACGGDDSSPDSSETETVSPTSQAATGRLRIVSSFASATFPNPATDYVEPLYANSELLLKPTSSGPVPWLAESYNQVDDTTWTVTLKPGLKFQNGNVLDAAALAKFFSYDAANDPLGKAVMGNATAFNALDDLTVEIDLPEPYPAMPYALASYAVAVYDSDTVVSVDGKYEQLAGKGVFTGPYMYMSSDGTTITYDANPYYYMGAPAYEGLTVRKIDSDTAGAQALANGEADIQFYPSVSEKRTIASNSNLFYKTSATAVVYSAFCLNPAKSPFEDVQVRKAFALAIDNDTISSTIMNGVRPPLKGVFQDDFPLNVPWKTYDPAQAESLLDAAGWTRNGEGPRTKNGETLSVEITTYDSDQEAIATAAVDMLRTVGFDAKVDPQPEWSTIPPLVTGDGPVNVTMQNLQNIGYEGNYYLAVSKDYNPTNQYNLSARDDEIWGLFEELLSSSDKTKVNDDFKKVLELDGERVYYVPVVANPTAAVVTKAFENWEVDPFYPLDYSTKGAD